MTEEQLIAEACKLAGLKPGFDREEESYYQKQKVEVYDAFIAGFRLGLKQPPQTEYTESRDGSVTYKSRNGTIRWKP